MTGRREGIGLLQWGRSVLVLTGAFLGLFLGGAPMRGQAQDAGALMKKMIATYQGLSSYSGRANIDQVLSGNGRRAITNANAVTMRFKRPNKLQLIIENPGRTGTRSIYSDGDHLTVYDALPGFYNVGSSAPTLKQMLPLLRLRARVDAELDPLYFLANNSLPSAVRLQGASGSQAVNGRPCYVVNGLAAATGSVKGSSTMHWTWYIDHQTFLIDKIAAHSDPITMTIPVRQGKKVIKRTAQVVATLYNTIQQPQANPNLADDVFHFTPPAGAVQHTPAGAPPAASRP